MMEEKSVRLIGCRLYAGLIPPLEVQLLLFYVVLEHMQDIEEFSGDCGVLHHSSCPVFERGIEKINKGKQLHAINNHETHKAALQVVTKKERFSEIVERLYVYG